MHGFSKLAGLLLLITAIQTRPAAAQVNPPNPVQDANAAETRERLTELLAQYPPTLVRTLQIDPTLLTNKEYLQTYPALSRFLASHPEISRAPTYFLGVLKGPGLGFQGYTPSNGEAIAREVVTPVAVSFVLVTVALSIGWIIKSVIEHTRWNRMIKNQSEIHLKLMERFTSSEDLLAYIQSPAGRRFLESAPVLGMTPAAPVNSILWSMQAGVVLALGGIGLNYATYHLSYTVGEPLFVLGVLAMSVGGGFILSALISYVISQRMGLIRRTSETPPT
jgi:hypothetical protein